MIPRWTGRTGRVGTLIAIAFAGATPSHLSAQVDSIDHVEAIQVVQDSAGSVRLISGKTTLLRVFYSGRPHGAARGRLWVRTAGGPDTVIDAARAVEFGATAGSVAERRRNAEASLSFVLSKPREGTLVISRVELRHAGSGALLPCQNCGRPRTLLFERGPELRVQLVGLRRTQGANPRPAPRPEDFAAIERWITRNYPIGQLHLRARVVDTDAKVNSCETANIELGEIRAADMGAGHHPRTRYYGVLFDKGGEMRGCSAWVPSKPNPAVVASGPAGPRHPDHDWDRDGSYADWYAGHEIGHTLARQHIIGECGGVQKDKNFPFPGGRLTGSRPEFVGWEANPHSDGPGRLLPGDRWHDVMTYCQQQWMSSFTYEQIRRALEVEEKSSTGPVLMASSGHAGTSGDHPRWVALSARVNLAKGAGAITSMIPTTPVPRDTLRGTSPVSVRIRNASGALLDTIRVSLLASSDDGKRAPTEHSVHQVLRLAPNAHTVELLLGGRPVDADTVSGAAPELTRVDPPRAAQSAGPGAVEFTWDASGAAKDALTYTVQVWFDDEVLPETMATGLRQRRIVLDGEQRMGRTITRIEVIASDGVRVQGRRTKVPSP